MVTITKRPPSPGLVCVPIASKVALATAVPNEESHPKKELFDDGKTEVSAKKLAEQQQLLQNDVQPSPPPLPPMNKIIQILANQTLSDLMAPIDQALISLKWTVERRGGKKRYYLPGAATNTGSQLDTVTKVIEFLKSDPYWSTLKQLKTIVQQFHVATIDAFRKQIAGLQQQRHKMKSPKRIRPPKSSSDQRPNRKTTDITKNNCIRKTERRKKPSLKAIAALEAVTKATMIATKTQRKAVIKEIGSLSKQKAGSTEKAPLFVKKMKQPFQKPPSQSQPPSNTLPSLKPPPLPPASPAVAISPAAARSAASPPAFAKVGTPTPTTKKTPSKSKDQNRIKKRKNNKIDFQSMPFPKRLLTMLDIADMNPEVAKIFSWNVHGTTIQLHNGADFENKLLPVYPFTSSFKQFKENLRYWGFEKLTPLNRNRFGEVRHQQFLRHNREGCLKITKGQHSVAWNTILGKNDCKNHDTKDGSLSPSVPLSPLSLVSIQSPSPPRKQYHNDSNTSRSNGESSNDTFPYKLLDIMDRSEYDRKYAQIISWVENGSAIQIYNTEDFETTIMPSYFSFTNFRNFYHQLFVYGFKTIGDKCYYHRHFQWENRELCQQIEIVRHQCIKRKYYHNAKNDKINNDDRKFGAEGARGPVFHLRAPHHPSLNANPVNATDTTCPTPSTTQTASSIAAETATATKVSSLPREGTDRKRKNYVPIKVTGNIKKKPSLSSLQKLQMTFKKKKKSAAATSGSAAAKKRAKTPAKKSKKDQRTQEEDRPWKTNPFEFQPVQLAELAIGIEHASGAYKFILSDSYGEHKFASLEDVQVHCNQNPYEFDEDVSDEVKEEFVRWTNYAFVPGTYSVWTERDIPCLSYAEGIDMLIRLGYQRTKNDSWKPPKVLTHAGKLEKQYDSLVDLGIALRGLNDLETVTRRRTFQSKLDRDEHMALRLWIAEGLYDKNPKKTAAKTGSNSNDESAAASEEEESKPPAKKKAPPASGSAQKEDREGRPLVASPKTKSSDLKPTGGKAKAGENKRKSSAGEASDRNVRPRIDEGQTQQSGWSCSIM